MLSMDGWIEKSRKLLRISCRQTLRFSERKPQLAAISLSSCEPFNSQDLISNSSYCLPYNSCDVCVENLVLDQPLIP